jgi:hypothetical protein
MPDVQYKGWVIEAQSCKSDGDRWRPKALVSIHEGGSVRTRPVPAPLNVLFDTEQNAHAYAIEMAKKWIDDDG